MARADEHHPRQHASYHWVGLLTLPSGNKCKNMLEIHSGNIFCGNTLWNYSLDLYFGITHWKSCQKIRLAYLPCSWFSFPQVGLVLSTWEWQDEWLGNEGGLPSAEGARKSWRWAYFQGFDLSNQKPPLNSSSKDFVDPEKLLAHLPSDEELKEAGVVINI